MAERKNSEARIRTNNKWTNAHYDRINIAVPKGRKDEIKALADTQGQSVNAYIIAAVDEKMEWDGGTAPEIAQNGPESTPGAWVVSLPSEALKVSQESAETGIQPAPVDKVKAAENLFRILGDLGTVDLDKARCERLGIMYLPPDILETAQQAAERTGETVVDFVARAVAEQQRRDDRSFKMGIIPHDGETMTKG